MRELIITNPAPNNVNNFGTSLHIKNPKTIAKTRLKYLIGVTKEPERWERVDGRRLMVDNFEILDIKKLHPYKIIANIFKVQWTEGFIPERNYSISNINKLFLKQEEAYANIS